MSFQNVKNQFSCDRIVLSNFLLHMENYCLVLIYKKA